MSEVLENFLEWNWSNKKILDNFQKYYSFFEILS